MKINCMVIIGVAITLALIVGLVGCGSKTTPQAPQDVIAVWKATSCPQVFPPSISKQVTLAAYGRGNDVVRESIGYFTQGEWIDVVVESVDIPILFGTSQAGYIGVCIDMYGPGSIQGLYKFGSSIVEAGGWPIAGKFLYLPDGYVVTKTGDSEIYTTAYRFFLGYEMDGLQILFANFNPSKSAQITYEVYHLTATPDWIGYSNDTLFPWLNLFPEDELVDTLARWMQQFK